MNRAFIPILNKQLKTFTEIQWFLDKQKNILIKKIDELDFELVKALNEPEFEFQIYKEITCIYINAFDSRVLDIDEMVKQTAIKIQFIFNIFSINNPILLNYSLIVEKKGKVEILRILDIATIQSYFKSRDLKFQLKKRVSIKDFENFEEVLSKAISKEPALYFTLEKFNSSLTKTNGFDKIIDFTICLESIIKTDSELAFKFSLFHSHLSSLVETDLEVNFVLLKQLYIARSKIVHGALTKKVINKEIEPVINRLTEIEKIVRTCLNYYIFYLFKCNSDSTLPIWTDHINKIILKSNKKIK